MVDSSGGNLFFDWIIAFEGCGIGQSLCILVRRLHYSKIWGGINSWVAIQVTINFRDTILVQFLRLGYPDALHFAFRCTLLSPTAREAGNRRLVNLDILQA